MNSFSVRPTHAEINLSALRRNVEAIRSKVYPAKVLVMLKANAYGHGIDGVAPYIEPFLDAIGVAVLEEGIYLRSIGIKKPVIVFGGALPEQLRAYLEYDLILTVSSYEVLYAAEETAKTEGKHLKVHLKVDTGIQRAGVRWYEAEPFLEETLRCKHLDIEGIFTHFANSETQETPGMVRKPAFSYASTQLERFNEVLTFYSERGLPMPIRHAANSGAILNLPESYYDMVRPGLMFYGIYADKESLRSVPLEPALTWKSKIVYTKTTMTGHPVSYGSLWAPDHEVNIATIPCGYGDGYFRVMSNKAQMIFHGKKYQQVGRICMDQCMFNLESDQANVGDEVILLGKEGDVGVSVEDLAEWAGTNPNEVLTNISARVPRVFTVDEGG